MSTLSRFYRAMARACEAIARARMQSTLLVMGREWVEDQGYSYDLLRGGVDNWPWRRAPGSAQAGVRADAPAGTPGIGEGAVIEGAFERGPALPCAIAQAPALAAAGGRDRNC